MTETRSDMRRPRPVVLAILDGWGERDEALIALTNYSIFVKSP